MMPQIKEFNALLDEIRDSDGKGETYQSIVDSASEAVLMFMMGCEFGISHNTAGITLSNVTAKSATIDFTQPFVSMAQIERNPDEGFRLWINEPQRLGEIYLKSSVDQGIERTVSLTESARLIQIARDHSDSIILLPSTMRSERISALANKFSRSADEIKSAFANLRFL